MYECSWAQLVKQGSRPKVTPTGSIGDQTGLVLFLPGASSPKHAGGASGTANHPFQNQKIRMEETTPAHAMCPAHAVRYGKAQAHAMPKGTAPKSVTPLPHAVRKGAGQVHCTKRVCAQAGARSDLPL